MKNDDLPKKRGRGRPRKIPKIEDTQKILDGLESLQPEIIKPVEIDDSLKMSPISPDANSSKQFDLEALEVSLNKSLEQMTVQIEEQKKILKKFKSETVEAQKYSRKLSQQKDSIREEIRQKQSLLSDAQDSFMKRKELNLNPKNPLINWFFNHILGRKDRIFLASKIGELEESILMLNEGLIEVERTFLSYTVTKVTQEKLYRNTEILFDNLLSSRQTCQSIRTEVRKSLNSIQRSEDKKQLFEDYKNSIQTLGTIQKQSQENEFDRKKASEILEIINQENPLNDQINYKIQKLLMELESGI